MWNWWRISGKVWKKVIPQMINGKVGSKARKI